MEQSLLSLIWACILLMVLLNSPRVHLTPFEAVAHLRRDGDPPDSTPTPKICRIVCFCVGNAVFAFLYQVGAVRWFCGKFWLHYNQSAKSSLQHAHI